MPSALYWSAAALLAASIGLWPATQDRSRLRTAWAFIALFFAFAASLLAPGSWLPPASVVNAVAISLVEIAAIQIAVVVIFDLALHRFHVPKFATEVLIVAGYLGVIFHLLYRVGVNVTGIFATSAVAAAVIGFALQDMLSNIASGIALQLEGGIDKNDFIQCGEFSGRVLHVRLRHTAIATPEGDTVILPNSHLTRAPVGIHSHAHRHFVPFAMPYSVDPHELTSTVEFALRASPIHSVATRPEPTCIVREMTPGHIAYAAVVWLSDPVDILRRTPILRLLSDPDLHELATHLRQLSFAEGEHIIRQGQPGDSMYFVVDGKVGITFRSPEGIDRQFSVVEPGDFFGEASLLTGETRSAGAIALCRVECYRLDKGGLQDFIRRLPDLAEDMSVVMAHRQTELDTVREKLDRETAMRREAESQNELLNRIRRFFAD
jgi:CRP-like cAMP-binding protein